MVLAWNEIAFLFSYFKLEFEPRDFYVTIGFSIYVFIDCVRNTFGYQLLDTWQKRDKGVIKSSAKSIDKDCFDHKSYFFNNAKFKMYGKFASFFFNALLITKCSHD